MNEYFKEYYCPSCNEKTDTKKLKFEYKTNRYIKYLNNRFNLNDKLIIENTELSQCLNCDLIFFNKWLKEYYIKILYSETRHHSGWSRFFMILSKNQKFLNNRLMILKFMHNRFNNIYSYAEFGCPFMGFLLIFSLIKNKEKSLVYNISNVFLKKNIDDTRYYKKLSIFYNLIGYLNIIILKTYNFFNNLKNKSLFKNFDSKINPQKLYFIKNTTERNWNLGCNIMNINCKNLINMENSINFVELKDLSEKIDLVYLDNSIDHTENISKVLNKILNNSNNILIQAHGINDGVQHSFFLTLNYLKKISIKLNFKVTVLNKDLIKIDNDPNLEEKFYLLEKN